jgi:uncharacterized protein (UPF0333 family)
MVHRLYVHDTINNRIVVCVPSIFLFVTTILLFIVSCTYSLCTIHFLVCDYNSIVYCMMYIRLVYHPFSHDTINNRIVVTNKKTGGTQAVCTRYKNNITVSCTYSLCTIHFLVCDYNSIVYCMMYIRLVYHPFSCLWLQFYCLTRKWMVPRQYVHDTINNRIVVTNKKTDGTQAVCTWYKNNITVDINC